MACTAAAARAAAAPRAAPAGARRAGAPRRAAARSVLQRADADTERERFPGKFVGEAPPEDLPRHLQERGRINTPWDAAKVELAERFGASPEALEKAGTISDEEMTKAYTMMQVRSRATARSSGGREDDRARRSSERCARPKSTPQLAPASPGRALSLAPRGRRERAR